VRPSGCTRCWRTPGPELGWVALDVLGSRAGRCWRRWWAGPPILRCSPSWPPGAAAQEAAGVAGGAPGPGRAPPSAAGRRAAGAPGLPGGGHPAAVGRGRPGDRPVLATAGVADNDPRRGPADRCGHRGRDRHRHGWLPNRRASGQLGGAVPGQQRVGWQALLRQDPQGIQVAADHAEPGGQRRRPQQRHLPGRPLRPNQGQAWAQESDRRGGAPRSW
jgi:hypothetical protein